MSPGCPVPGCRPSQLCDRCYGRELFGKRAQAQAAGRCWAERRCRTDPELQALPEWPSEDGDEIAAREVVAELATDPRLIDALGESCLAGAVVWWAGRPDRYRA